ncbi:MAG TPA: tetratricopeptide repeat protein [Pirellulaceae bacterium]|nr:tetratricopeptide repeat protein [Pirellulaceae bacterium]
MKQVIALDWNHAALVALLSACVCTGCATPAFLQKTGADVAPQRSDRREVAVRRFEAQRDTAQYHAAIERWSSGDPFTCEAQLRGLVARNPKSLEARRALADMALERGDSAGAEAELRELLELAPDDAQTHHSLGLLLESTDRAEESRKHLTQAAKLDPDNTLYQLCLQTDSEVQVPPVVVAKSK